MLAGHGSGAFVVRVSDKHKGYAITALYANADGQKRFSHIMALPQSESAGANWLVADREPPSSHPHRPPSLSPPRPRHPQRSSRTFRR